MISNPTPKFTSQIRSVFGRNRTGTGSEKIDRIDRIRNPISGRTLFVTNLFTDEPINFYSCPNYYLIILKLNFVIFEISNIKKSYKKYQFYNIYRNHFVDYVSKLYFQVTIMVVFILVPLLVPLLVLMLCNAAVLVHLCKQTRRSSDSSAARVRLMPPSLVLLTRCKRFQKHAMI